MLYLLLINFTHFACINSFYHHNNSKKQVLLVSIYILWNERTQSCLTLCDPMDCSPPGSSLYGILQARILEWVVIHFFTGSSQPREDQTWVSHIAGRFFTIWATREAPNIALGEIKCVWLSIWHGYAHLFSPYCPTDNWWYRDSCIHLRPWAFSDQQHIQNYLLPRCTRIFCTLYSFHIGFKT